MSLSGAGGRRSPERSRFLLILSLYLPSKDTASLLESPCRPVASCIRGRALRTLEPPGCREGAERTPLRGQSSSWGPWSGCFLYSWGPSALGWSPPWARAGWSWGHGAREGSPACGRPWGRPSPLHQVPPRGLMEATGLSSSFRLAGGPRACVVPWLPRGPLCPQGGFGGGGPTPGAIEAWSAAQPADLAGSSSKLVVVKMLTFRHKQEFPVCPSRTWGRGGYLTFASLAPPPPPPPTP